MQCVAIEPNDSNALAGPGYSWFKGILQQFPVVLHRLILYPLFHTEKKENKTS